MIYEDVCMRYVPLYRQISLGSSDTLFMWIDKASPQLMGHVFVNPVDENAYMAMLWYVTIQYYQFCTMPCLACT